ncbi:gustatory and pheromone receptor 32a-like [Anastrepha ludens]|uniref:gustatory and pheromone receptor 32a-like n=1 Tax=Anastrepha ludens TaxID=28586 RepID=UPI0023AF95F4|nr:gustatory and pheromone receptor 32a-like [Anastrepha ludens]
MSTENIRLRAPLNVLHKQTPRHKLTTVYHLVKDLKWILLLLKVFGIIPIFQIVHAFKLTPPKARSYSTLYTSFMRIFAFLVVVLDTLLIFTPTGGAKIFVYGELDNATIALQILLSIAIYGLIMWKSAFKPPHFITIINSLLNVDKALQLHPRAPAALHNNCAFHKVYVGLLVMESCTIWVMNWVIVKELSPRFLSVGLYFLYLKKAAAFNGYIIFVAALLHLLAIRFRYLNNFIEMYTTKEDFYENLPKQSATHANVRQEGDESNELAMQYFAIDALFFYRMHNKLLEIYKKLNDYVHSVLLFFIALFFYASSMTAYQLYFVAEMDTNFQIKSLVWCGIFICVYVPVAALLMSCCDAATKEVSIKLISAAITISRILCEWKLD